jgi:hypothetical protein
MLHRSRGDGLRGPAQRREWGLPGRSPGFNGDGVVTQSGARRASPGPPPEAPLPECVEEPPGYPVSASAPPFASPRRRRRHSEAESEIRQCQQCQPRRGHRLPGDALVPPGPSVLRASRVVGASVTSTRARRRQSRPASSSQTLREQMVRDSEWIWTSLQEHWYH